MSNGQLISNTANTTFWSNTVFDPGVVNQYQNATVYTRGGMTLQALRARIGDDKLLTFTVSTTQP